MAEPTRSHELPDQDPAATRDYDNSVLDIGTASFPTSRTTRDDRLEFKDFVQRLEALADSAENAQAGLGEADRSQFQVERIPGYEILSELGRGGMGVVFKARQKGLNRIVAIKMVLNGEQARPAQLIRFLGEAEAVAAIDHPNVVRVHESGQHSGSPYLVMEYLDGGSLSERLSANGPVSPETAAELVLKIARGVQAAHGLNIVHRDLKPANVLFDQMGNPKVADFGLAKRGSSGELTATGALLGTPDYMAPEQASGTASYVGPPADVWALGVVLFECITGRRPFAASVVVETLRRVCEENPTPLLSPATSKSGAIPRDLRLICAKCLEKSSAHRYQTARELADDLQRFLAQEPIAARSPGPVERVRKWARRKPTQAALVVAIAALLLTVFTAGSTLAIWKLQATDQELRAAENAAAQKAAHSLRLEKEQQRTNGALRDALEGSTRLVLSNLSETGDSALGLLRLAHELVSAVDQGANDLERVDRFNIAFWMSHTHKLHRVFENGSRGPVDAAALSQDGSCVAASFRDGSLLAWSTTGERLGKDIKTTSPVFGLKFAPRGRVIAILGRDSVELWDLQKCERRSVIIHHGGVWAITFSPDGSLVVTGGEDRLVRVTSTESGADLYAALTHEGPVHAVAVSPDGTRILTGSWDCSARLWSTATGKKIGASWKHEEKVQSVAISPDGKTAATGAWNGLVHLWQIGDEAAAGAVLVHRSDPIAEVEFSPDGRTLLSRTAFTQASVNRNHAVQLWDPHVARLVAVLPHVGPIQTACWTEDGRALTGGFDGVARLWNADGSPVGSPIYHRDQVRWICAGPQGKMFMTADSTVRLWNRAPGFSEARLVHDSALEIGLYSPDGTCVFIAGDKGGQLFDVTDGTRRGGIIDGMRGIRAAAFLAGGRILVTARADGAARLWATKTGKLIGQTLNHKGELRTLCASAAGSRFMTGDAEGNVRLWDATGQPVGEPAIQGEPITRAVFSPDGRIAATCGENGSVKFWDTSSGASVRRTLNHGSKIEAVEFAPDGSTVVTGGVDGIVRIWDTVDGTERSVPLRHDGAVRALAISTDGLKIATASNDRTACLWDARSGSLIGRPMLHGDRVTTVAFSPDGATLASGSSDQTARLWDFATQLPIGPPIRFEGPVRSVAFDPGGRSFLAVSLDHTARLLRLTDMNQADAKLIKEMISIVSGLELVSAQTMRVLTAEEWQKLRNRN